MVGAADRSSRGSSERRSGWRPSWTRLIRPSVTAETFSCSISAGLTKYSAVTFFQGLTAKCQCHSEKVDNAHLKPPPPTRRLNFSLSHCEKLQTFAEDFIASNAQQVYLFSLHLLCVSVLCISVKCGNCMSWLNWDVWPPVVFWSGEITRQWKIPCVPKPSRI